MIPSAMENKDRQIWKVNSQGCYKVKDAYNLMLDQEIDFNNRVIDWEDFQKLNLPPKYLMFSWS